MIHLRHSMLAHQTLLGAAALGLVAGCSGGAPQEAVGTNASAGTVCAGTPTPLKGMDVSHYDGMIDWPTAHAAGIDFAIVKATEGTTFTDPMFSTNWAGMKAAGVVRGAYHFFHSNVDPAAQAAYVASVVGPLQPGDLPITIDLEVTDGNSEATVVSTAKTFLDAVTKATGATAMIYVSPAFLSDYSSFAPNPLWIANWGVTCPDVPAPWATWTFWQNSSTGTVSGVSGASAVDLDEFNGTLADLTAFSVGGGSTPDAGSSSDAGSTQDSGSSAADSGTRPPDGGAGGRDSGGVGTGSAGSGGGGGGSGGAHFGSRNAGGCSILARTALSEGDRWAPAVLLSSVLALISRRRRRAQ